MRAHTHRAVIFLYVFFFLLIEALGFPGSAVGKEQVGKIPLRVARLPT